MVKLFHFEKVTHETTKISKEKERFLVLQLMEHLRLVKKKNAFLLEMAPPPHPPLDS
jgi:hypothetical protein